MRREDLFGCCCCSFAVGGCCCVVWADMVTATATATAVAGFWQIGGRGLWQSALTRHGSRNVYIGDTPNEGRAVPNPNTPLGICKTIGDYVSPCRAWHVILGIYPRSQVRTDYPAASSIHQISSSPLYVCLYSTMAIINRHGSKIAINWPESLVVPGLRPGIMTRVGENPSRPSYPPSK